MIAEPPVTDADRELLRCALAASGHAYAPYSRFAVGAAVRTASGRIHLGANLENASLGLTLCAEAAALCAANTAGDADIREIAVVGRHLDSPDRDTDHVVMPCGRCRQLILEAARVSGATIRVLAGNGSLTAVRKTDIDRLLPEAFGPRHLRIRHAGPPPPADSA